MAASKQKKSVKEKTTAAKSAKAEKAAQSIRPVIEKGYAPKGPSIALGCAMQDGAPVEGAVIRLPLKTFNRHGLIAGATGTGKTKTLQNIAGELSRAGVPSLVMDIKGDLSGIAAPGEESDPVRKRADAMQVEWRAEGFPVEFLTLSDEPGARLRATTAEFGPVLLARILDLNATQTGLLSAIFKFCDDQGLLLLDLPDLKGVLQFITNEGKGDFESEYGQVSAATAGTILRKIVALEQQGAERFFGEPSFDVEDLLRIDSEGRGVISVLRLRDIQSKPALFSTFMLQLLAEVYERFPEEGDLERPKLCLFLDEAHLVFDNASDALLQQIEMIVRLIRSKAVGVFFCTQSPTDLPDAVLGQLGLKVQHALRAFTAKDRKALKAASENFPLTDFYETDRLLSEMGIGEALVTGLNEKGRPTPLAHTLLSAPASRMDPLTDKELKSRIAEGKLAEKYNQSVNRKSAYEMLAAKAADSAKAAAEGDAKKSAAKSSSSRSRKQQEDEGMLERIADSKFTRDIGRTVAREVTRGVLGVFGISTSRRRGKKGLLDSLF